MSMRTFFWMNYRDYLRKGRDIDFNIELHLGTSPISMTPQRMAPTKFQELKVQLQEMLYMSFIRPSTSPWGAPMLFQEEG